MKQKKFTIKEQHIKLLNKMYINWQDCEFGAPAVDCKRPYGDSMVYNDLAEALGYEQDEDYDYNTQQEDLMNKLHAEMETVLQILVRNATDGIKAGETYACGEYGSDWRKL